MSVTRRAATLARGVGAAAARQAKSMSAAPLPPTQRIKVPTT
jgi:hypothetical protein